MSTFSSPLLSSFADLLPAAPARSTDRPTDRPIERKPFLIWGDDLTLQSCATRLSLEKGCGTFKTVLARARTQTLNKTKNVTKERTEGGNMGTQTAKEGERLRATARRGAAAERAGAGARAGGGRRHKMKTSWGMHQCQGREGGRE